MIDDDVPTVPLVSILYREHAKYLNEKIKGEDLSFGLFPLLITIYKNEGIIQEDLAQAFHLNESTITRNLRKLEEKGFIERIPQKRKKLIKVTEKGKKTAQKVMDYHVQWDNKIKEIIGLEEYDHFRSILMNISNSLIWFNLFF